MKISFILIAFIIQKYINLKKKNIFNPPNEEWYLNDNKRP